jgi:tetratricopeptide (TPR) repeat protein
MRNQQQNRIMKQNNFFKLGITLHNLGVLSILAGRDYESLELFEEAISIKRQAFGKEHPEVAVSLDELGIQFFSRELYQQALEAFSCSVAIIEKHFGPIHPKVCMLKNNIACCHFCTHQYDLALQEMKEALEIQQQQDSNEQRVKNDLDLLHMAIVLNNFGYLKANDKVYEDARMHFEEALLIQQSVLGDTYNHRAIRDSRSNLDFTNTFHS